MNPDQIIRDHLLKLLNGRQAHLNYEDILDGIPFELQGIKPADAPHTAWQLLEHLRIAQWDILEFSRDAEHPSPPFPQGYWPPNPAPPDKEAWSRSFTAFKSDLRQMQQLVTEPSTDLYSVIAHGNGQTILREALLVADHNAYHLGQLLFLRRQLGCGPSRSLS